MNPEKTFGITKQKLAEGAAVTAVILAASVINWQEVKEKGVGGVLGRYWRGLHFLNNLSDAIQKAHGIPDMRMEFPETEVHQKIYVERFSVGNTRYSNLKNELNPNELRVAEADTRFPNVYVQQLYYENNIRPFRGLVGINERRINPLIYSLE